MLLGAILTVGLWLSAGLALRARLAPRLILPVIALSVIMPALGVSQVQFLPGGFHWMIRALHLLVGAAAIGLGQTLLRGVEQRVPGSVGRQTASGAA